MTAVLWQLAWGGGAIWAVIEIWLAADDSRLSDRLADEAGDEQSEVRRIASH